MQVNARTLACPPPRGFIKRETPVVLFAGPDLFPSKQAGSSDCSRVVCNGEDFTLGEDGFRVETEGLGQESVE